MFKYECAMQRAKRVIYQAVKSPPIGFGRIFTLNELMGLEGTIF